MADHWYTDRTRYTTGLCVCPRLRYLRFHHDGTGIARRWTTIPLSTGTHVHRCLELILKAEMTAPVTDKEIRVAIKQAVNEYLDEVKEKDLSDAGVDVAFTIAEQCHLIAGLAWAWVRVALPSVRDQYEILKVEEEEVFPISHSMTLMSRPDLVMRRKFDGALTNHDFKTASSISDGWEQQWKDSIQLAVGTLGLERSMGEEVKSYYLHGIVKGGRNFFAKKRGSIKTPQKRQYSKICYAQFYPPTPPLVKHPTWDFKGIWFDKTPVWEQDFTAHPKWEPEMTVAEFWVKQMPLVELRELIVIAGPYERPSRMMKDLPGEMEAEELRWKRSIEQIKVGNDKPEHLNGMFPRSYNCYQYNSRCEFYKGCRENDWGDEYEPRKPHHTTEE